ncbi:MAG: hypothetical protein AAFY90_11295, partial [Pseudomonadota bacterium]
GRFVRPRAICTRNDGRRRHCRKQMFPHWCPPLNALPPVWAETCLTLAAGVRVCQTKKLVFYKELNLFNLVARSLA